MKIKIYFTFLIILIFSSVSVLSGQNETRLLRFPTLHNNQLVFTYAGDLYTVNSDGGVARRLTSHEGFEMFPRFSPDGKTIAFTGQYDGNTEVFTIPAQGGVPKRITITATLGRDDIGDRMGPNNLVMGWTPDGNDIVFRSRMKSFNAFKGHIFTIHKDGGIPVQLPFSVAGFNSFSPDGKYLAFNQVFREFRTWKYYKGGMADDIRVFNFSSKTIENVSNHESQDIFPMWYQNKIYFLSDRDRTMNLFVYSVDSKTTKKLTNFTDYDIKFPSLGTDAIVFEKGGYIYRFDLKTEESKRIPITINNDLNDARTVIMDAADQITSLSMSPAGNRLAISARGEVFNIPVNKGISRNLTQSSGVHERNADWSPDGRYIAYISDETGEFEIHLRNSIDLQEQKQLTKKSDSYIFGFNWSPDSKKIAYHDKKFRLWWIDLESGKKAQVDQSGQGPIGTYEWSPDSKWLAYVNPTQGMDQISLYNLDSKKSTLVTDSWYNSDSPVFSRNGKYLFFVSARDFQPSYSRTEWNHIYQDMNALYFINLSSNDDNPLGYTDDEIVITDSKKKETTDEKDQKNVTIDLLDIQKRITRLPVDPGEYFGLEALDDKIFYVYMNSGSAGTSLKSFDLASGKETTHGANLNFTLSSDGKKMLLIQGKKISVISIPGGPANFGDLVNTSNMKVKVDKAQEWAQIFNESWRQMRDFFYDPGMHGVDWDKIHKKYYPLVEFAMHRSDLTYIIGEMVGELNVGHAYVNNGQRPMPERIPTGLLGANYERDKSGYFKITEILEGANWSNSLRSPLKEIGIKIEPGDLITAINGNSTAKVESPNALLIGQANQVVELTVAPQGNTADLKKYLVKPVADESSLYYYQWVQGNIEKVNKATNGEIGYIHIPDMGVTGLNEFIKHYYPQLTKKALIIDDRGNGGGNVSPMIIERLMREITYATMHTNQTNGSVNPVGTMAGPKVALIDQYSASDGDLFPYRFKYHNLGKTIGVRTWGGVVGYSGAIPCIDGGSIITPSYAPYAADGSGFIIEGIGVEPDIIVENSVFDEYVGIDNQLTRAIEVLKEELKAYKKTVPPIPDFPKKN